MNNILLQAGPVLNVTGVYSARLKFVWVNLRQTRKGHINNIKHRYYNPQ